MQIEARLFASLKDGAGRPSIRLELAEPATVADLLAAAAEAYPRLRALLPSVLVAVNRAYAAADTPLAAGDEVALFPPVSGGQGDDGRPAYFALTSKPVDLNAVQERLWRPDVGAIVTFSGRVRGQTRRGGLPAETRHLEYEAYQEMAHQKMAQIAAEIWQRWPLVKGIAIVQRVGKLEVGELTTLVACAAGHRDQGAFEAARFGIDRLKEIVPVWKKEVGSDHSVWIEGDYRPTPADNEMRRD
ncbi:MAG: molybdenum cofactor biosynthesis protein [Candidatus Promineifilaceae bacterium]